MKGNDVNPQARNSSRTQGGDQGESLGVKIVGMEKIMAKLNGEKNGIEGEAVSADKGRSDLSGSRFTSLDSIEEMDGIEFVKARLSEGGDGREKGGRRVES